MATPWPTTARPPLFVDYGDHITIGDRTFINCNLTALDVAPIVIGADCQLGPSVQLLTPIHPIEPQPRRDPAATSSKADVRSRWATTCGWAGE